MALTGTGLTRSFGGVTAVAGVDVAVDRGEILGLVGPNGAGKTTLFNILSGFVRPDAGTIRIDGRDVTADPPHVRCAGGLGRTFQLVTVLPGLSCVQNVMIGAHSRTRAGIGDALARTRRHRDEERAGLARAGELLALVELDGYELAPADSLAFGHRRRLELARALMGEPEYLLMDEPASGANRAEKAELAALVSRVRADTGIGIVLVEHSIPFVVGLADRMLVLAGGARIFDGPPDRCLADREVQRMYLGSGPAAGNGVRDV